MARVPGLGCMFVSFVLPLSGHGARRSGTHVKCLPRPRPRLFFGSRQRQTCAMVHRFPTLWIEFRMRWPRRCGAGGTVRVARKEGVGCGSGNGMWKQEVRWEMANRTSVPPPPSVPLFFFFLRERSSEALCPGAGRSCATAPCSHARVASRSRLSSPKHEAKRSEACTRNAMQRDA